MAELDLRYVKEFCELNGKAFKADDFVDYVLFSKDMYMTLCKEEAMDLYNIFRFTKVYFVDEEGRWLLDRFGDITLQNE